MRWLLTLLPVLLFGCQSSPEVKKTPRSEPLLSLERTACFGTCPVYVVEVLTDGTTRFKGERHVKVTEPVEVKLEPAVVEKLSALFEKSQFAKWSDFTRATITDMPTVVLTYRGHTVRHNLGFESAPSALLRLEDQVEAIIGTDRWVNGTGSETQ